jgi:hypothetical protein
MSLEMEDDDIVFPVVFDTKDYREALALTRCITGGDPRKRVMFANIKEGF